MNRHVRIFGILALTAAGGYVLAQAGADILAKLGITRASAAESVLASLSSGYIYDGAAYKAFKALPAEARAGIVRAGLAWIKDYTGSAEFKAAYAKHREDRMPRPPDPVPSAEESMAKMKADIKQGIENMRQAQASADAEMKKMYEETIKQMQAQLEEIDKNPQMKGILRQGAEMERKSKEDEHAARMKAWNEDLPENSKDLIAQRIRQFLDVSADVDYQAELASRNNRKVFVKEAYEKKSAYWKICFRAGREATEAARTFAQAWLDELGKS